MASWLARKWDRKKEKWRSKRAERDALRLGREWLDVIARGFGVEGKSRSQIGQDLFALAATGGKRGGWFVEFGAADGVNLSNTWLLEKEFGWQGILAEPSPVFHDDLRANRDCHVDTDCVWSESGQELEFIVAPDPWFSSPEATSDLDMKKGRKRTGGETVRVPTVSLADLLDRYDAPGFIDYISLDTEGSEYEILYAYDWSRMFGVITVEHVFTPNRKRIHDLLTRRGYRQVLMGMSKYDDWYVLENAPAG